MMPFTFAHPAIILPFGKIQRASVSMSALVIGSITPDFEYFIRMKLTGRYSHTIEGMFLLDLPVAIVIAYVFHQLVKAPLIDNSPSYFRNRLSELRQFAFLKYVAKSYHAFILCLLVGIGSHILWDSFTHSKEYFVQRIDLLSEPLSFIGFPAMPVYRYLQHASTVLGFIAIAIVFHNLPFESQKKSISFRYWIIVLALSMVAFSIRASLGFEYFGDVVATGISAMCIGLIGSSLFARYSHG